MNLPLSYPPFLAGGLAASLLLVASPVNADVVTYASSQSLAFGGSTSNGSFLLQRFDPSLGTLTGVSITVGLRDWDGVFTFSYDDIVIFGTNASCGVQSTVNLPSASPIQVSVAQKLAPTEELVFEGGGNESIDPTGAASSSSSTSQSAAWASSNGFVGSGTKSLGYSLGLFQVEDSAGTRTSELWQMSGALDTSVTYTYNPVAAVPEPSEWGLGAVVALWGLGWASRRRTHRA